MLRSILFLATIFLIGCADIIQDPVEESTYRHAASPSFSVYDLQPEHWSDVDDERLWAAVLLSDTLVDIGVKDRGMASGFSRGRLQASIAQQASALEAITRSDSGLLINHDPRLATARLKLSSIEELSRLRASPYIDFVEPAYIFHPNGILHSDGSSGCGASTWTSSLHSLGSGEYISSSLASQIPLAWHHATGAGITLTFIGTGISSGQPQLASLFSTGSSSNRSLTRSATYYDPMLAPLFWRDDCGHESRLISVAAGPRNGGGLVGIAFQSNLHSIRAISNVLLLTDSQHVVDAIELAAVTVPERNVMNLAFGSPTYKDNIARQIEASSNDMIIMVGAAGTSPSWMGQQHKIAFPARMPEVVAVTGINADGSVCGNCHRNVQIEFGAYTDEPSLNPYAQASHNLAGPHVSISGSSGATAVISGIAALTWSANPGLTAQGVIQRMKSSSAAVQLPNHSPWQSGSGMPNAACAVGGICRIEMQGPSVITEPGHHVYTAKQIASNVDATYDWSTGHTTSSAPLVVTTLPAEDEHVQLSVTVTDHKGVSITRSRTIIIRSATSPPDCPPQVIVCPDN